MHISDEIEYNGPQSFPKYRLIKEADLFLHRAALYFTPTHNIPDEFVGAGPLNLRLPIATPSYLEAIMERHSPRLWVDLLQRATGKLRWLPFDRAHITLTRFDAYYIRSDFVGIGSKALIDALKARTFGRPDGMPLYYFGCIVDDAPKYIDVETRQELVGHLSEACCRLTVRSL